MTTNVFTKFAALKNFTLEAYLPPQITAQGWFATGAKDVVAVLRESDLQQVFAKARAIKATVMRSSQAMSHPLETGASIIDHRIILPNTVELSLILASSDYRSVYQQIRDIFINGELLTVQTRVDSYTSMIIEKMPHDESPDMYDGVALALSLKEAKFVTPQFSALKVAQPKNSNTVKRGEQQPQESKKQSSILSGLFK